MILPAGAKGVTSPQSEQVLSGAEERGPEVTLRTEFGVRPQVGEDWCTAA